jgi:hypothetical protein
MNLRVRSIDVKVGIGIWLYLAFLNDGSADPQALPVNTQTRQGVVIRKEGAGIHADRKEEEE